MGTKTQAKSNKKISSDSSKKTKKKTYTTSSKSGFKDKSIIRKVEKETKLYFYLGIFSLVLFFIPVLAVAGSIITFVKSRKNEKYGLCQKKIKTTKTIGIVGIILGGIVTLFAIASYNPNETFNINGQDIELVCENNACSKLNDYGDNNATRMLAEIGVRKIDKVDKNSKNIIVTAYDSSESTNGVEILVQYNDSEFNEISEISSKESPTVIYYSKDSAIQTVIFPSVDKIKEEKARKEAEEKAAAEAKAAEDAKYPTEEGTQEICDKAFHKMYPYNGSKIHSIMGVIALARSGENKMIYKAEVTIENAYGAKYDSVMECTVSRDAGTDTIRVDSFNIY